MDSGPTANLRILALVTDAFGGEGGIAQFNRDLLRALAVTGVASRVIALPSTRSAPAHEQGKVIEQLEAPRSRTAYAATVMKTLATRGPFDVVFCGHLHLAPVARLAATLSRSRLWLQLHGIEAWERPGTMRRRAAESADLVAAVSRHTRRRFLSWAGMDPRRVRVLPNTVGEQFTPGPKRSDLVASLGIGGKKVLLTVARLSAKERYKGHDRVIECLPALRQEIPNVVYLIAGDGDDRHRLEQLARDLEVGDAVRFVGRVDESELPEYFRLADAYVMPSAGEGFGIVFLEAAATGLPVVAGNGDGSVDALADGALGALVTPGDNAGLHEAIRSALQTPSPIPERALRFGFDQYASHVRSLVTALNA